MTIEESLRIRFHWVREVQSAPAVFSFLILCHPERRPEPRLRGEGKRGT